MLTSSLLELGPTASKFRNIFFTDVQLAARTGRCGKMMHVFLTKLATFIKLDTQGVQSGNRLVTRQLELAPRAAKDLVGSRVTIKKSLFHTKTTVFWSPQEASRNGGFP